MLYFTPDGACTTKHCGALDPMAVRITNFGGGTLVVLGWLQCIVIGILCWVFALSEFRTNPSTWASFATAAVLLLSGAVAMVVPVFGLRNFVMWIKFSDVITVRFVRGIRHFEYAQIAFVAFSDARRGDTDERCVQVRFKDGRSIRVALSIIDETFVSRMLRERNVTFSSH